MPGDCYYFAGESAAYLRRGVFLPGGFTTTDMPFSLVLIKDSFHLISQLFVNPR